MRPALAVLVAVASAALAPPTAQAFEIHAHRGGTVSSGKPAYAEESLAAYKHAAANGFVLEVDAKLTKDGIPVAIHDATVDRTTTCTGEVRAFTLNALLACPFDVLGSPGSPLRTRTAKVRGRIATIAEVLELARLTGARLNLEIKNLPTDPDYDPTPGYANRIMDVVEGAGLKPRQILIQSFWPANLDVAKQRVPHLATALLTLGTSPDSIAMARDKGYGYLSPQWPLATDLIDQARGAGLKVLPFTLDTRADVRAAARAKVDGVITDDPLMAARALGLRPPRKLTARLLRHPASVEVHGRLLRPGGVSRRKGCVGAVALQVLSAGRTFRQDRARLKADCSYQAAVRIPRGAPTELLAIVRFAGNDDLLPRLVGPRSVPAEVPLGVPHASR
jgi:glycerophosphoryl diester phosphodiesterase